MAGGVVGAVLAPTWEFAPFVVTPVGAVTGAIGAQFFIVPRVGAVTSVLTTVVGVAVMMHIAGDNPDWVVQRCALAVGCAGGFGIAAGVSVKWLMAKERCRSSRRYLD